MLLLTTVTLAFFAFFLLPIAISATLYWFGKRVQDWRSADRSSAGLLPPAQSHPEACVRIFAARTVSWRGIVAVHSWIVLKDQSAPAYDRFDYTAWGEPIRVNGFVADGRWFGELPEVVFAVDGDEAARFIPGIRSAVAAYRYRHVGDYQAWPGPNSNTFVAAIIDAVPGMSATLPPTAIGKDFPYDGRWLAMTPNGGLRLSFGGYAGFTLGWREGIEVNILGAVAGLDVRRPALKLPAIGRVGLAPR
jgi:Protein of unknown function (DUF3750)